MTTCTKELSENSGDFWVTENIPRMDADPLRFLRDGVSAWHPVIINNLADEWPAMSKWSLSYFESRCGDMRSEINITPNGKGDAITSHDGVDHFVYPAAVDMAISDFCKMLSNREPDDAVPYLSQQDNNLVKHFPELLDDIEQSLSLADDAFGCRSAEAVNLWIGDERSTSSLHKDHFENLYVVVSGEKVFTLLPPTDIAFLSECEYPTLRYSLPYNSSARPKVSDICVTSDGCPASRIPWIDADLDSLSALTEHPSLKHTHPIRVRVRAGETLYIPAMWYHQVTQSKVTVAVNYWYEQRFDFRYVFYQLAKSASLKSEEDSRNSEQI